MTEPKRSWRRIVAGVSLTVGALVLGTIGLPSEAVAAPAKGCITKKEFLKYSKVGKRKAKFERQVGARGPIMGRAFRQKVIQYEGCGKLEGVRVIYYYDSRTGKWRGKHFRGFLKSDRVLRA